MKYKYRKLAALGEWLSVGLILIIAIVVIVLTSPDKTIEAETLLGGIGMYFAFVIIYSGELIRKYIELFDEHAHFYSFRFKNIKLRNTVSFNVKYKDILNISARRLPVIGIWGIKVTAKNLPHAVTLSFCFCNHNEMYDNLCKFAKQHNPNVYIDSRLTEFLERKRHD